ncbi:MAG TPA: YihY/virulence factor BrkB family protein [Stellaceae bacterium]|nr:YihY/virulence factor BrkB family protein [Stellaceae bacterium]
MRQTDGHATEPRPLPRHAGEWWELVRHIVRETLSDHATMTAAGLAFYSLLGIVPILIALTALYGLMANPAAVRTLVEGLRGFLPAQAADLLANSLKGSGGGFGLGISFAVSLGFVLWTAQWASSGLITALNIAFDAAERRSFVRRQIIALVVAVGGIVFICLAILVVALLPAARSIFAVDVPFPLLLSVRWPLLALLFMLGLSALYSLAPSRPRSRWRWLNWGAIIATLLWIGASAAFSAYASRAGSFNRFYGPLGGVAIFLFWLYLSGLIVILGAEIEAEVAAWRRGYGPSEAKRMLSGREKKLVSDAGSG